jgi:HEAT repeat protein
MFWWTLLKLRSDKPAERKQAVMELSRMQDSRAVEVLAQALKDKDWECRSRQPGR